MWHIFIVLLRLHCGSIIVVQTKGKLKCFPFFSCNLVHVHTGRLTKSFKHEVIRTDSSLKGWFYWCHLEFSSSLDSRGKIKLQSLAASYATLMYLSSLKFTTEYKHHLSRMYLMTIYKYYSPTFCSLFSLVLSAKLELIHVFTDLFLFFGSLGRIAELIPNHS